MGPDMTPTCTNCELPSINLIILSWERSLNVGIISSVMLPPRKSTQKQIYWPEFKLLAGEFKLSGHFLTSLV